LDFAVKLPEVLHFHCWGSLAFDGVVDDADCGSIINVNGSRRLGMSEFFEAYPHDFGLLCIEKEGTVFGFRCRGSDELEDHVGDVDSTIDEDRVAITWNAAEEKIALSANSCLRGTKIGSIGMDVEDHVGCTESNFGIGMCPHVIKKLVDASVGFFCRVALLGGDCQKSHKNSWVDGACII
jgi:hypothetical protein